MATPPLQTALRGAVESARQATRARCAAMLRRGPPPLDEPHQLGFAAELLYCARFGAAAWYTLPRWLRRRVNGGARMSSRDYGVDAVALSDAGAGGAPGALTLVQLKWYADGLPISADADLKLAQLAHLARRGLGLPCLPRTVLAFRAGARPAPPSSPGAAENERQPLTDEEIGLTAAAWPAPGPPPAEETPGDLGLAALFAPAGLAAGSAPGPPLAEETPGDLGLATIFAPAGLETGSAPGALGCAAFVELQAGVAARARALAAAGAALVRMRLPTGFGKSYVMLDLARDYRPAGPVVIIAPRVEIALQIAALAEGRGGWARVLAVCRGEPWPSALSPGDLVVSTGQSVGALGALGAPGRPAAVAALFIDEAHSREGHAACAALVESPVRFELSACLAGKVDIEVTYREAVARGLVCQAQFVFDVFPRQPSLEDVAAELAARPEHASVLACFQTCRQARAFAAACAAAGAGPARTFVDADPRDALDAFRAGAARVLCVVGRVEMGVNIHRCDTVLFVEPWASWRRDLQLIGRGVRLHPTKPGFFSVVCPVGPADVVERRVAFLVETLHTECAAFDPQTLEELDDLVEVREARGVKSREAAAPEPDAATATDAVAAVHREVYDAVGRRIEDPVFLARLRYGRARELVAAAVPRPATCRAYAEWRGSLLCKGGHAAMADLPADPPAEFGAIGFSWDEFLSLPPLPADFAEVMVAAAAELAAGGFDVSAALCAPTAPLYELLRATEAGRALPGSPLRGDGAWLSVFAPLFS